MDTFQNLSMQSKLLSGLTATVQLLSL